jgi:hypothetical protein
MAEKPIIFSTPMVRAIITGWKTQTRRVVKPQPEDVRFCADSVDGDHYYDTARGSDTWLKSRYLPGDVLWVREMWRMQNYGYDPATCTYEGQELQYRADFTDEENARYGRRGGCAPCKWRPSIHMPRSAARIFLRVTDVRVERLQKITAEDCIAEGVFIEWSDELPQPSYMSLAYSETRVKPAFIKAYATLWDGLNAKRGYGWDTNPWVWVYTFEQVEDYK